MTFRSDINGLRALAVLAVIFYHYGVAGFGGGYVGVDVFYVISGFLMTQIICTKQAAGRFRLLDFYKARARRILPALGVVVAALLAFGLFYMPPNDYKLFGRQALSALGFYSNISFSHQRNYFDATSQSQWLLHTWSLAVEWQFYILLPLMLMGLRKRGGDKYIKRGVVAISAVSLLLSAIWTQIEPTGAFFLLPTRTWEMLAGGLVFLYAPRPARAVWMTGAGIAAILAATFFYSYDLDFPGLWALLPVTGAALVIAAGRSPAVFDARPVQFLGRISYSLYLWHWPVIVALKYFDVPLTGFTRVIMLLVVTGVSTLSYTFIEKPFRHEKQEGRLRLAAYALVALAAWLVVFNKGLPTRMPVDVLAVRQEKGGMQVLKHGACGEEDYKKSIMLPRCILGAETAPTAAVWGDSHTDALSSALGLSLAAAGRAAYIYSYAGCPSVRGAIMATKWKKEQCKKMNDITFDYIAGSPEIRDVFLFSRWSLYIKGHNEKGAPHPYVVFDPSVKATEENMPARAEAFTDHMLSTMCALAQKGKNVYVLAPVPELGKDAATALERSRLVWHRDAAVAVSRSDYAARNAEVLAALAKASRECGVHIIDTTPLLCDAEECRGIKDGHTLYADDNHLNSYGNVVIQPLLDKILHVKKN